MQIPIIKKLVEQYSLAQLQSAEEAMMEEQKPAISEEELLKLFSTGEKVERTPRNANPQNNNKKKKGKK
jgi:hypothetical protein